MLLQTSSFGVAKTNLLKRNRGSRDKLLRLLLLDLWLRRLCRLRGLSQGLHMQQLHPSEATYSLDTNIGLLTKRSVAKLSNAS